jgi:hypothetical protein
MANEAKRGAVLQMLRECDSTSELLGLVLEAHLELLREQLVADATAVGKADSLLTISAPWSLGVGGAHLLGQTAPALLKEQIAEFRDEEESDLRGDAPPAPVTSGSLISVAAPAAAPTIEQQVLAGAVKWARAQQVYVQAWTSQAQPTNEEGMLIGEALHAFEKVQVAHEELKSLANRFAEQGVTAAAFAAPRDAELREVLRNVTRLASVFVEAMLEVGPEAEPTLVAVDHVLAAKTILGEGPGPTSPAVAVARSA